MSESTKEKRISKSPTTPRNRRKSYLFDPKVPVENPKSRKPREVITIDSTPIKPKDVSVNNLKISDILQEMKNMEQRILGRISDMMKSGQKVSF